MVLKKPNIISLTNGGGFEGNPAQGVFAGVRVGDAPAQSGFLELFAPGGVFLGNGLYGLGVQGDALLTQPFQVRGKVKPRQEAVFAAKNFN